MLLGAQFCSDSFSSISLDAVKDGTSYSFYARSLELVFQGLNILLKNALYCRALLPVVISAPTHILSGSTLAFRS